MYINDLEHFRTMMYILGFLLFGFCILLTVVMEYDIITKQEEYIVFPLVYKEIKERYI